MFDISFFPLGNADTTRIVSPNSPRLLFDFAPLRDDQAKFDLEKDIRDDLKKAQKDSVDVLCITHVDSDHCRHFEEFFYLKHSTTYQDEERIKIGTLWVPAMAITETGLSTKSARQVQKEARHRLREGKDIVVISEPKALDDWFKSENIKPEDREDCIVHAGEMMPGWDIDADQIEFFVHSPLTWRQDTEDGEIDRNANSIVLQAVMKVGGHKTRFFLGADVDSEDLTQVVKSTQRHGNNERLEWDILKLFHHCSYKALNKEDRGENETTPVPEVKKLIEDFGESRSIIVSPSEPIPSKLSKSGDQPPHKQASNYYDRIQNGRIGQFKVTMDTPKKPINVTVSNAGAALKTALSAPAVAASTSKPARAG